jgi:hypothetical protein
MSVKVVSGGLLPTLVYAMILVEPHNIERIIREGPKYACSLVINTKHGKLKRGHRASVTFGETVGLGCPLPVNLMKVQDLSVGTHIGVGLLTNLAQSTESLLYLLSFPTG